MFQTFLEVHLVQFVRETLGLMVLGVMVLFGALTTLATLRARTTLTTIAALRTLTTLTAIATLGALTTLTTGRTLLVALGLLDQHAV